MKPIYLTLILILLNVGLIHQVFLPLYTGEGSSLYQATTGYKKLKQESADYKATLEQASKIAKQAKELQDKYKAIQELNQADLDLLKIMVPDSINEVKLHSEMTNLLVSEGFSAEKLGVSSKSGSGGIVNTGSYSVSFTLEDASYEKLKSFLGSIERSKRILSIKSISVTPAEKPGDIYKFDVTAETYYLNIIAPKK